ncbi:Cation efflux system protein CusC precursor [Serratia entomophila]|uniref:efflux transporter outer membrane subunit n=1 Tax=Serratia entomophila TaxID=42906 RepID=UPI00217C7180|nr:efflux transporter outer membrane subunit [Serratia entomophila]CAI1112634.1 Cation efflux system protein CusC precursor [Serratia entomophila]CAI1715785.1 Cation efflux system protein CusC precursor [Serratia entomophila]CAI1889919.1 Cation efflux system protein CusC precursor [Serratia entomophila]CAI1893379.1 Cation efflux system protein CusC precursor [Serratia entomophila]CAI1912909.1 Cation efflux system protein CusC precursor [Serratia entomophila]
MNKFVVSFLVLLLGGCAAGGESQRQLSLPQQWRVADQDRVAPLSGGAWWDNFNDPQLSALIGRMLAGNQDLALAGLQWRQALLEAGLVNGNLTPDMAASLSGSNSGALRGGGGAQAAYRASLALSYELDLWGKLARAREQAAWLADASELDRQNTALVLIGTTARLYWQVANLNQQYRRQQAAVKIARDTLQLVKVRHTAGDAGKFELLQAGQSLLERENQQQDLQQQRESARNSLALLFGQSSFARREERQALPIESVAIIQRQPVAVLAQRPDVQAAERRLRAALAGAEVARLSFYPTLSLDAALEAGGRAFRQWFGDPARALGGTLALPFIEWRKMRLSSEKALLQAQQAEIQFRDAVYRALADVDNAMEQRLDAQRQIGNQRQHLAMSRQGVILAQSQYRAGAVSLQTLLDAQTALLSSENALSELQYRYLNATMQLWLALGGAVSQEQREGVKHG